MAFIKKIIFKFLSFFNYRLEKLNLDYFPIETSDFEKKIIKQALKYSMTNNLRMCALVQSFKHVINNNVNGDFVECGVWMGGNLILL
jgi:O-methyltransferase